MSMEKAFFDKVKDLAATGTGVCTVEMLPSAALPFLCVTMHSDSREEGLDGHYAELGHASWSVDVVGKTLAGVIEAACALRDGLEAMQGQSSGGITWQHVTVTMSPDLKETQIRAFRRQLDVDLFYGV